MKKIIATLIVLAVTLFTVNSFAWSVPATPKPASAISDSSNVLSVDAHQRLDNQLTEINKASDNEIAILIIPSLDGMSIDDVGYATAKSWGVGKSGLDNGVLIILAMKEHKSRIETGKGVEGDLPDLKCNDILTNVLRPHMRSGDVEGGLKETITAISTSIADHKAGKSDKSSAATEESSSIGAHNVAIVIFLSIFGFVIFALVMSSGSRTRSRSYARRISYDDDTLNNYKETNKSNSNYDVNSSSTKSTSLSPKSTSSKPRKSRSRSSYSSDSSSSSSYDSGSSSSYDSGSSFGGGDFGGGGSSGDW